MGIVVTDNLIRTNKYKIEAKYSENSSKSEYVVNTDEEKDTILDWFKVQNLKCTNPDPFIQIQSEELAVVYREENLGQPDEKHEMVSITCGEIVHGKWTKHLFTLTDADYGNQRIFIKYGNDINEKQLFTYISLVKIYPMEDAEKYLAWGITDIPEEHALEVEGDNITAFQGKTVYKSINWDAFVFIPDTEMIPAGTKELIVEVEYFTEPFPVITPAPKPLAYTDIEVIDISVPEDEWADGESSLDVEDVQKFLDENRGKWKNRAERLAFLECENVRKKRNKLLDAVDVINCNALNIETMTTEEKEAWRVYKQALRDITVQPGFPYEVEFPISPA